MEGCEFLETPPSLSSMVMETRPACWLLDLLEMRGSEEYVTKSQVQSPGYLDFFESGKQRFA